VVVLLAAKLRRSGPRVLREVEGTNMPAKGDIVRELQKAASDQKQS